ncbi:MAG: hypothetical protein ACOYZ7_02190 [Chloroflexota bacterium]
MSHKRFLPAALAALIVIGLLFIGGAAIRQSAWNQGYVMGQLAANNDGGIAPYAPYYAGYHGQAWGLPSFLCTAGLLVLGLAVVGRFFRHWAWKTNNGPQAQEWAQHWKAHWRQHHGSMKHGPMPPWCWGEEKPEARPEPETDDTAPES